MSRSTPCMRSRSSTAAAAVAVAATMIMVASTLLAMAPPVTAAVGTDDGRCDPSRDVQVNQTAGTLQPDGTKEFDVAVTNQRSTVVSDVHLDCGYRFRFVGTVDPGLLVQHGAGESCLLIGGGAIAPGGRVSFSYASYNRYPMTVVSATCSGRRP